MDPETFIRKWRASTRTERSASQEHFLDLCALLEIEPPGIADPDGGWFTFDFAVKKTGGGQGFVDAWRKGCFGWEYKGDRKNLVAAYAQVKQYTDELQNPPLLIVSDMREIRVHTNFTNEIVRQEVFQLADLNDPAKRERLRWCFAYPERWRPTATRETVTVEAAASFAAVALRLQAQGFERRRVAHFLNKLVFCLFAEDIDLLPDRIFAEIVEEAAKAADDFVPMLTGLFGAMRERHGRFGTKSIPWFNGGLFDDDEALPVGIFGIPEIVAASRLDWGAIEPTIFGTLFERGLDEKKRRDMARAFELDAPPGARLVQAPDRGVGIYYTDPATIMKLIEPVVLVPLRLEWQQTKARIDEARAKRDQAASDAVRTRHENERRAAWLDFRERLGRFRVLDPACGSGNFLALALRALKDFDRAVQVEGESLELPRDEQRVTARAMLGLEINPYAAELARLAVWITELQWQLRNGFAVKRSPILDTLDGIECRDALVNPDGTPADWPAANVVIGNPPWLGGKRLRALLGDQAVERLFNAYAGRVPAEADLVAYWFAKAWERVCDGRHDTAGLVTTNSIRGGANRRVLDHIAAEGLIYDAWDDEPWVNEGVAARVSLVAMARTGAGLPVHLDGESVKRINADLTASGTDLTTARRLPQNAGVAFMGDTKGGAFDIPGDLARKWLQMPLNPNGRPNTDVLRPWINGMDITRRPAGKWIIDFGWTMDERAASLYEAPFTYAELHVRSERVARQARGYSRQWWQHERPRPEMWSTLSERRRYIGTPTVAKHRLFRWIDAAVCPDHQVIANARDDDTTFGILHSRFHEVFALRLGTWLGVGNDPRYTPSTTFETFPFPEGLTPNIPASAYATDPRAEAIAVAARTLNELRERWLNPPDLVRREPEVVPGFPDRILPTGPKAAAELKTRTLTNLYNARPTWLANAHRDLDAAVAAAYGWPADISDDDALAQLLALNLDRSAEKPS